MVTGVIGGKKSAKGTEVHTYIYLPIVYFVSRLAINHKLSPITDHRSHRNSMDYKAR